MSLTRHHFVKARITVLFSILLSLTTHRQQHVIAQDTNTLIISQYMEGSGYNKALQLLNLGESNVDLSPYSIAIYFRGSNANDGRVTQQFINIPAPNELKPMSTFTICHERHDNSELRCDLLSGSLNFNGNDAVMLVNGSGDTAVVLDSVGSGAGDGLEPTSEGWDVCDVSEATEDHTLKRKTNVKQGNGGVWEKEIRAGSEKCEWEVEDMNVWDNSLGNLFVQEAERNEPASGTLITGALFGAIGGVALLAVGVITMRKRKVHKRNVSIHYQYYGRNANGIVL